MRRCLTTAVLCLTACARPDAAPDVPPPLLKPVAVTCAAGDTMRALGTCALQLRAGLNTANAQIRALAEIINGPQ